MTDYIFNKDVIFAKKEIPDNMKYKLMVKNVTVLLQEECVSSVVMCKILKNSCVENVIIQDVSHKILDKKKKNKERKEIERKSIEENDFDCKLIQCLIFHNLN